MPFPLWQSNIYYSVGTSITDSNSNTQTCITAGVSGLKAPTWAFSGDTTDNTVVWMFGSGGG